jgi:hypothetical protein
MKGELPTNPAGSAEIAIETGDGQAQSAAEPDPLAPESPVSHEDPRLADVGAEASRRAIAEQRRIGPNIASTYFVHFH